MASSPRLAGLILKLAPGALTGFAVAARNALGADLRPLFPNAAAMRDPGAAAADGGWALAPLGDPGSANPWDDVHDALDRLGAAPEAVQYAEPDLLQEFPAYPPQGEGLAASTSRAGKFDDQDPELPVGPGFAWHLRSGFSDLRAARDAAGKDEVCILHVDTGYDPTHVTVPEGLLADYARDFVEDRERKGAVDPGSDGVLRSPGHGTGTLGILAGNRVADLGGDYLGGAPHAKVIPVRIAKGVVLLRTSGLARALDYALGPYDGESADPAKIGNRRRPVDVVTLSMGGLASRAWAEAVNAAYEAGVLVVAAAGNCFAHGPYGLPTRFIVFPARFRRVLAACGVMADWKPYFDLPTGTMEGCWGPPDKMTTALSAFTPNISWAERNARSIVDMNGAGTSSATPQIAAAAALYVARHRAALGALPERWQRVEAVRRALFLSAHPLPDPAMAEKLGRGVLQARAALDVEVAAAATLTKLPRDSASVSLLRVLTGMGAAAPARGEMLAVEATQLAHLPYADGPNPFESIVGDPDAAAGGATTSQLLRLADHLRGHPRASRPLRDHLDRVRATLGAGRPAPPAIPEPRQAPSPQPPAVEPPLPGGLRSNGAAAPVPFQPPRPVFRDLAAFAFDPSVAQRLMTKHIGVVAVRVPWEDLAPGPVGEYLEVIDVDPSTGCFYAPVDLDHPHLLAGGGLAPAEGTPQFHQQMAYAVASKTIDRWERALGRKALWSPQANPADRYDDSRYVQRLRIYPHALREANAYYSPPRKALLFGYFRASPSDPGDHLPGSYVFTCLSHDIVAHETTHALLDGMHRRFNEPTNLDMRAFHEAFADVVALMQHFTFPEVVRDQIARTRGEMRSHEHLLGELATEFGRSLGQRSALRDYIGHTDPRTGRWQPHEPDPTEYEEATEPHARGAILVSAVFDAFLSIYERRTRDLLRIATGGTGELPPGDLHPALVNRLAEEAARAADHVLVMCIRALDYCPPVDLTFGEYLRALITADRDLIPDDDLGYRVAFTEAFRRRAIYPRDVRTLSEDALLWRGPPTLGPSVPSPELHALLAALAPHARSQLDAPSRQILFHRARALRAMVHDQLATLFDTPGHAGDAAALGLELSEGEGFEVHAVRFADRIGPDGQLSTQCILELLQRREVPRENNKEPMSFEGGATVVVSLRQGGRVEAQLRYIVRKSIANQRRREEQRVYLERRATDSLWSTYFGERPAMGTEPFAVAHRS